MIGIEIQKTRKKRKTIIKAVKASMHNPTISAKNITENIKGMMNSKNSKDVLLKMGKFLSICQ